MLPLHAIPTEVIRKGFRSHRGFLTGVYIDLPPEDLPLRHMIGVPQSALSDAKSAELALDVTPILEVFAKLFGYDPKLLNVGNGDCGVEGHDWNLYGAKQRVPQLIRWRAFGGEALVLIGCDNSFGFSRVVALTDEVMAPQMAKVFEAIGSLNEQKLEVAMDRPVGDLLEKVMTDLEFDRFELSAGFWHELKEEKPTSRQLEDLANLRFSCRTRLGIPREGLAKLTKASLEKLRRSRQPGQRIALINSDSELPIVLCPEEPTPRHVLEQIYAQSVKDVERLMQEMMEPAFQTQVGRVQDFLYREELAVTVGDPAENERAFALAHYIGRAEAGLSRSMNNIVLKTTFGREFRGTPAKNLLGTDAVKKLSGGDVMPGNDLIQMLISNVINEADLAICGLKELFTLKGRIIASDDLELQRDKEAAKSKAYKLEKPYTTLYRGLPIRVMDSYVVFHGDGSEGLACDYYVDHQNQALHFVSLYRVKAPKTE
jgi:hypothetical protein